MANTAEYILTITDLQSFTTKTGEDGYAIKASDGDRVGIGITNPDLYRVALGDKIRVTVTVVEEAEQPPCMKPETT